MVYSPVATVKCPWCTTQYLRPDFSNCKNCGGTLPLLNQTDLNAIKPPLAPRELPKKYVRRIKYTGNVMSMIGVVFTVVFFWSVIFPIIGIICWRKGLKEAEEELIPLRSGTPVMGEIESIQRDYSKKINNRSPFTVTFLFNAGGQTHRGNVGNIFEDIDLTKKAGDKIWVVYMPENPALSSIWPPLK